MSRLAMISFLISDVLKQYPKDACKISLNGHVRVGFDYSKGVSRSVSYELKGYRYILFCWWVLNRCPKQISGSRNRTLDRTDGLVDRVNPTDRRTVEASSGTNRLLDKYHDSVTGFWGRFVSN